MSNTNIVSATLSIELNVECPHCEEFFDLIEHENMNEEGAMINAACPDKVDWHEKHDEFSEDGINCPHCHKEINVRGIDW